jgi:hypothetical protein
LHRRDDDRERSTIVDAAAAGGRSAADESTAAGLSAVRALIQGGTQHAKPRRDARGVIE